MKRVVINIRASKNISGLVKVSVTSPAGLIKFFLNVEPWHTWRIVEGVALTVHSKSLSQDFENGCPKWGIIKKFGHPIF